MTKGHIVTTEQWRTHFFGIDSDDMINAWRACLIMTWHCENVYMTAIAELTNFYIVAQVKKKRGELMDVDHRCNRWQVNVIAELGWQFPR